VKSINFSLRLSYGQSQKHISVAQAHELASAMAEGSSVSKDLPDKVGQAIASRHHV